VVQTKPGPRILVTGEKPAIVKCNNIVCRILLSGRNERVVRKPVAG
jgi:hypothetical protein